MSPPVAMYADYRPDDHGSPEPRIRVRRAATSDVDAILRLHAVAGWTSSSEALAAMVADPDRFVAVVLVDDELVGWARTHHWPYSDGPAEAGHYLGGVSVVPGWRRRGVASALTRARMSWIGDRADRAWCVVNVRNGASIDLHLALGFREVARASRFHTTHFTGGVGVLMSGDV